MNFSKKNHEHKKTNIFFVSKTFKLKFLKRFTFLMCIALLSILISCNETQKPENNNEGARAEMLKHIVPIDNAVKMYHNYSEMRIAPLEDSLRRRYGKDFNDTRTLWLDLETVKQYIAYVEEKSAENNVTPDGLQFYLSVYPNDSKKYPKKKNHQTFFIAPTTKKGSVQYGYTLNYKDGKASVLFLKDIINNGDNQTQQSSKTDKAGFFSTTLSHHQDGLLLNDTSGTPPGGNK